MFPPLTSRPIQKPSMDLPARAVPECDHAQLPIDSSWWVLAPSRGASAADPGDAFQARSVASVGPTV
jgi:hypothetical protein